jgi:hypothetical protein
MKCPLYNEKSSNQQKAHGCACSSPVCSPSSDCNGSITRGCTVPAFIWRKLVVSLFVNNIKSQ